MPDIPTPDWVRPGAEGVYLRDAGRFTTPVHVTVERVLKRDVVLSNGERVRQPSLSISEGTSWSTRRHHLVAPDDPRALAELKAYEDRVRARNLRRALDNTDHKDPSEAEVVDVLTAFGFERTDEGDTVWCDAHGTIHDRTSDPYAQGIYLPADEACTEENWSTLWHRP